jgi:hypothetical protein
MKELRRRHGDGKCWDDFKVPGCHFLVPMQPSRLKSIKLSLCQYLGNWLWIWGGGSEGTSLRSCHMKWIGFCYRIACFEEDYFNMCLIRNLRRQSKYFVTLSVRMKCVQRNQIMKYKQPTIIYEGIKALVDLRRSNSDIAGSDVAPDLEEHPRFLCSSFFYYVTNTKFLLC